MKTWRSWIGLLAAIGVLALAARATRSFTPPSTPSAAARLPAVADVWLSGANPGEADTNSGQSARLKLKHIQEMSAVRFDVAAARGREVRKAYLYLRRIGDGFIRYVRVSTTGQDWAEGRSRQAYGPPTGATFLYAEGTPDLRRAWAWPGSCFADAIMTSGGSIGCWAECEDRNHGWIAVPIAPELIYAMCVGDSDGLAVMNGGDPGNANNFFHSVQSGADAPFIEVDLGPPMENVPARPKVTAAAAPDRAHLGTGAVRVSIAAADDVFCWRLKLDGRPVPRWQVKHPPRRGPTVFFLDDLEPSRQYQLEVAAVSAGGKASPPARMTVTSSPALSSDIQWKPLPEPVAGPAAPAESGPLAAWALPGLVKIDPADGSVACDDLAAPAGQPPSRFVNPVWNGKWIRLFGARGEYVSFQLCLENRGDRPLGPLAILFFELRGPDEATIKLGQIELYRNGYSQNRDDRWQPAYCVPFTTHTRIRIPDADRNLPRQRNQTVYVDLYIPKDARPGNYLGAVVVEGPGRTRVSLPMTLDVLDFALPDRLSFWPELNAYRVPPRAHDYYRLAHQHRCVLNCMGWKPKLAGRGKDLRLLWDDYDRNVAPLLTGEAFAGSRRGRVPVECMYLPFGDSWPTPLSPETYDYSGHWPDKGESIQTIIDHYRTAPYIGEALSPEYKQAFRSAQRQFIEHFREKGYSGTEMQCFFGGKATHRIRYGSNLWWTTDEPYFWSDWLALQFFCREWTAGRGDADPRLWAARADISRPQWQGRVLDGIVNVAYYGAGGFSTPDMVRRCRILARDTGVRIRSYGSLNPDNASNTQCVSALLYAWLNGAEAFLPWQTLGSEKALDVNDRGTFGGNALLVPGDRFGLPVVADMRLKALRDGQQLIEYLEILAHRYDLNREQIRALLADVLPLETQRSTQAGVDNADATRHATLDAWTLHHLRRRLADMILQRQPTEGRISNPSGSVGRISNPSGSVGRISNPSIVVQASRLHRAAETAAPQDKPD